MPAYFNLILQQLELALRLQAAVPTLEPADAYAHAAAAIDAASPTVEPELLLAVAFVESRFDPTATSRIEGSTRKTGHYPSQSPPVNLARRGTLYCGPLQTFAATWSECVALRQLPAAYRAGASELSKWLLDRRVRGDVSRALAGHGCGNYGVTTGKCNAYPMRVLAVQRRIERIKLDRRVLTRAAAAMSPVSTRRRTNT